MRKRTKGDVIIGKRKKNGLRKFEERFKAYVGEKEEEATWEVKRGFIVSGIIEGALDWRTGKCIRS